MSKTLVFIELNNGKIKSGSLELLSAAKILDKQSLVFALGLARKPLLQRLSSMELLNIIFQKKI